MHRTGLTKTLLLSVALTGGLAACGRGDDTKDTAGATTNTGPLRTESGVRPAPVILTGCLTAQGDRFVLTQLERADAGPAATSGGRASSGTATGTATTGSATTPAPAGRTAGS